jgi:hypothetical protein
LGADSRSHICDKADYIPVFAIPIGVVSPAILPAIVENR